MTETYYPPRARWYSPLWRGWYLLKRWLYLDRLPRFSREPVYRLLLGMALPGWTFLWTGQRMLGLVLGSAYCLSAFVFFVWVGYPVSNFAMMTMISIHAGSILRIQESVGLLKRMAYSLLIFLGVAGLVYIPLRGWIERHWLVPLTVNGQVIVVHTGQSSRAVTRGDAIAYRLSGFYNYGIIVRAGCTLGRVLAVPGDEVTFGPQSFSVHGQSYTRLAYMPTNGTIQVQQHCWFIWPEVNVQGAGTGLVETAMMQLAIVPETSYVGVPFRRWLWRRQTVP
jgi:hypothetical protein